MRKPHFFLLLLCFLLVGIYFLPPVHDRLAWRVDELILRIKYTLHPPQEVVFVPQQGAAPTRDASATATSIPPQRESPGPDPTEMPRSEPEPSSPPTLTPTLTPAETRTPLPERVSLTGVRYDDQHGLYNYCAPANLSMALSFWGWQGDRDDVGPSLKPKEKDKNVMPYEMVAYVQEQTDLRIAHRVGGDLETLKRFLAAGFPVLVEKGTYLTDLTGVLSWMGHFQVITGYDESQGYFIAQDSYVGPDHQVSYELLRTHWRAFNYTYFILYPSEKESQVIDLLGPDWDETTNYRNAALKASNEIFGLSGIDQYFAWFNRGTSLRLLQDYVGAAQAYDEAFAVYPTIPEDKRPWRMLWYQTGPYFAYFYSGRYYDVLDLADNTLNAMQSDRNLEESHYWRGMANAALGAKQEAIDDFLTALEHHPDFGPALYQLDLLGVNP